MPDTTPPISPTGPRLSIGGVEFRAPELADTIVNGWQIIDGDVIVEGVYDVRYWSAGELEAFRRDQDAYLRFQRHPRWFRPLLAWLRGTRPHRPLRQRVQVANNYASNYILVGLQGVTLLNNVAATPPHGHV